ncbi:hypothetical protein L208DRAFT_1012373, partial [Tricholoma matsutake]
SCSYDTIVTILFNAWREQPTIYSVSWAEINNNLMTALIHGFNNHANRPPPGDHHFSLEDVQDYMRRGLIQRSADFEFGQFTSIAAVLGYLLKHNQTVTSSVRMCSEVTHPAMRETNNKCCLVTTLPTQGQSLQDHLDHFGLSLPSRCEVCDQPQLRRTTFKHHPPLLAFEWPDNGIPVLDNIIHIVVDTTNVQYILQGVIHYQHNHFTAHIKLSSGTWSHDGIAT